MLITITTITIIIIVLVVIIMIIIITIIITYACPKTKLPFAILLTAMTSVCNVISHVNTCAVVRLPSIWVRMRNNNSRTTTKE